MVKDLYSEEHEIFRATFRKYLAKEVVPHLQQWEREGLVPRQAWRDMGAQGFLCPWLDEQYGGMEADFLYSVIMCEEIGRVRAAGFAISIHNDIVVPYLHAYGSPQQKQRWLPACTTGEMITAIAMTEPDTGSDLQAIRTQAENGGDHYVINGQKTFISNGISCDLVLVVVKTDPQAVPPYKGISLIAVEEGTPGFIKSKKLEKMGLACQDTAEIYFEDCRVPRKNLIGREGEGFTYLMEQLQKERLVVTLRAQAGAESMLAQTIAYCKERQAFGRPISRFQHNTFKLVEMATEIELGKSFLYNLIAAHLAGKSLVKEVSMAKWWICEMANRVAYQCLQLHGGYGYMEEYEISKWYRDIRAATIYAGTTEIMKAVIAKKMGL